ncbi:MAG: 5'-nucleotidase C-terminal domain-containing protein [Flavobacteriaceae bacterium]|nr:5'-nucleotidase C-terminal domain-containing protein [Flavobacteriaceae bacterium]
MSILTKYLLLFTIVFNLISCKPNTYLKSKDTSIQIDSLTNKNTLAEELIKPYKTKLAAEMNEVLVISGDEFPKERGKPETKLGNLVADLSLEVANKLYQPTDGDSIDFCLLNFGGLRTSLPKGEITRGKVFELMPFENELVVVTISKKAFDHLTAYLYRVGGQPISKGLTLVQYIEKNNDVIDAKFLIKEKKYRIQKEFKIFSSDYLANGGDKMNFFLNPIKIEPVGIKLRDAIIQYCKEQHKKEKQLTGKIDGRITFE